MLTTWIGWKFMRRRVNGEGLWDELERIEWECEETLGSFRGFRVAEIDKIDATARFGSFWGCFRFEDLRQF
jgi:hypothetical protein